MLCVDCGVGNVVLFVFCRSLRGVRWLFDFYNCLLCVALCGVFVVVCVWLFVCGLFVVCLLLVVLVFGVWCSFGYCSLFVVRCEPRDLRCWLLVV